MGLCGIKIYELIQEVLVRVIMYWDFLAIDVLGKNFGLLIMDELNLSGFALEIVFQEKTKIDMGRRVSVDIQKKGIFLVGKGRSGFTKKMDYGIS